MKRTLMIGLLVLLTISVGMLISCSGEVKVATDSSYDYMMKCRDTWFDGFKTLYPDLTRTSVTSISFCNDKPESITSTGTDLTAGNTGKVMGYLSGTDIYIVGEKIVGNFDCYDMFCDSNWADYFSNLEKIEGLENFDTSKVTNMYSMFCYCYKLQELDLSSWDTSNVTDMRYMFYYCTSLTDLTLSSKFDTSNVKDMSGMFYGCTSITTITDISGFNTSNVENMYSLFYDCQNLEVIDLSSWDTSKVTNMAWMFGNCQNLTNIKLDGKFNTSSVIDMGAMFWNCKELTGLNLNNFNTSNVEIMTACSGSFYYGMFANCSSLQKLDLSYFNTLNVKNMSCMFYCCTSLTDLTLSSKFDTSKVTKMYGMFCYCYDLPELNLSSFNTSNVTDMQYMFYDCSSLKTIYATSGTDWNNTSATSTSMFYGCSNLKGGSGTTYTTSPIDKTYARIDGGTSKPGYFTAK